MAGEQLEPITRKEYFLAKAAGMDVETHEPITREEMFLSMISGGGTGGSGGADWNAKEGEPGYVKNRTHYEETIHHEAVNITWDGNTDGLVCVGDWLYKVSNLALTDEEIKSTAVNSVFGYFDLGEYWENCSVSEEIVACLDGLLLFVRKEGAIFYEYTFPEVGVYVGVEDGTHAISEITIQESYETVVHKLDKQYLPDEVFNGSKLIINASTTDYNTYTIDRSYAEIKEYADNGCDVAVQFMWAPNPGGAGNDPALYTAPLVHIQSDGSMLFTVDSYYPDYGKANFRITENEVSFSVGSYLPFSQNKGSYLVGKNSFGWEISPYPIVYSPNGTKYKISVDNNGTLSATEVT